MDVVYLYTIKELTLHCTLYKAINDYLKINIIALALFLARILLSMLTILIFTINYLLLNIVILVGQLDM